MDIKELVYTARTCRRFVESERLSLANLEWLVDCARVAPCTRNAQVLRFIAAHTEAACATIFPCTRWAGALKDWGGPFEGERPTGYIAILVPKGSGRLVHMDVGIAAQTMQLAAHAKGWGCCMHASFDAAKCAEVFRGPADMDIDLILAFGVAKEIRTIAPMPADGSFAYWRDDTQVHHVPKRSLGEVLISTV